jgi:hypothetical protein
MGKSVKKAANKLADPFGHVSSSGLPTVDFEDWKGTIDKGKAAANTNWQNTVDAAKANTEHVAEQVHKANMQVSSNLGAGVDSFGHAMDVNIANLTGRSLDQKKPLTTSSENYSNAGAKRKKGGSGGNKAADLRAGGKNRLQGKRALYKTKPSQ